MNSLLISIAAGPTFKLTLDCDYQWNGWWPDVNSMYTATATITCNQTKQFPQFAMALAQTDLQDMYELVSGWKEHYVAVTKSYDRLAQLTSANLLATYQEEIGDAVAIQAFKEASDRERVGIVIPPEFETFISSPPFGEILAAMLRDGSIAVVDSFLARLDEAMRLPSTQCDCSDAQVKGTGADKVVTINLNF